MMRRDDFETRLGQGLKRWAQAGEPTLDLEALVKERVGQSAAAAQAPLSRGRRWTRWLGAAAAAAALVAALGATFPTWAGAAAGWPLVGPLVTEIILADAGLKWAYDNGLIQGTLAQATEGDLTFRILGVMADSRRTTVIYQVEGLSFKGPEPAEPVEDGGLSRPAQGEDQVEVFISKVNGQGAVSFWSPGVETPLGLVGTVSTLPLETETAELEISFQYGDKTVTLNAPASRAETDKFSRAVPVGRSQEIDGVKITLESVTYTPAETVVTYTVEKPWYTGVYPRAGDNAFTYLEAGGKQYRALDGGNGVNNRSMDAYPPVEGPAKLVFPVQVKGVPIEAAWPLTDGAVAEVLGVPVTLAKYERQGSVVAFEWTNPDSDPSFGGIAGFAVIDRQGRAHDVGIGATGWSGESNYVRDGLRRRRFSTELPEGVEPVAVRATRAAVLVRGPWVFELPR